VETLYGKMIFVNGAGGFVGSAWMKTLVNRGAMVRALAGARLIACVIPQRRSRACEVYGYCRHVADVRLLKSLGCRSQYSLRQSLQDLL
jgi:hypothetical protein